MKQSEEYRFISARASWAIIIVFSMAIIGWGLVNWAAIKDRPRDWDYGSLPDTPAESVYSSHAPTQSTAEPPQFQPLPEARPDWPRGSQESLTQPHEQRKPPAPQGDNRPPPLGPSKGATRP